MRATNPRNSAEWLDLRTLQNYAVISERTIRTWIHSVLNPLPAVQVGGKILIRRRAFDAWLESHRIQNPDVSQTIEKILAELKHV
jgi:excisionase family DNA binding protein